MRSKIVTTQVGNHSESDLGSSFQDSQRPPAAASRHDIHLEEIPVKRSPPFKATTEDLFKKTNKILSYKDELNRKQVPAAADQKAGKKNSDLNEVAADAGKKQ